MRLPSQFLSTLSDSKNQKQGTYENLGKASDEHLIHLARNESVHPETHLAISHHHIAKGTDLESYHANLAGTGGEKLDHHIVDHSLSVGHRYPIDRLLDGTDVHESTIRKIVAARNTIQARLHPNAPEEFHLAAMDEAEDSEAKADRATFGQHSSVAKLSSDSPYKSVQERIMNTSHPRLRRSSINLTTNKNLHPDIASELAGKGGTYSSNILTHENDFPDHVYDKAIQATHEDNLPDIANITRNQRVFSKLLKRPENTLRMHKDLIGNRRFGRDAETQIHVASRTQNQDLINTIASSTKHPHVIDQLHKLHPNNEDMIRRTMENRKTPDHVLNQIARHPNPEIREEFAHVLNFHMKHNHIEKKPETVGILEKDHHVDVLNEIAKNPSLSNEAKTRFLTMNDDASVDKNRAAKRVARLHGLTPEHEALAFNHTDPDVQTSLALNSKISSETANRIANHGTTEAKIKLMSNTEHGKHFKEKFKTHSDPDLRSAAHQMERS